jgi:hypothetical protein
MRTLHSRSVKAPPSRSAELPRRHPPHLGLFLRAVLLLGLVTVAASSRGDTWAPDVDAPSPIGLQWLSTASYNPGDIVEHGGALYQATAVQPNTDETPGPSSAYWQSFDPANGAPGASGTLSQVTPVVNCIVLQAPAPGSTAYGFTAVFGYVNSGANEVIAPISAVSPGVNEIIGTSAAQGQGQPIAFEPGQHDAAFVVDSPDGTTLTWALGNRDVVAAQGTQVCTTTAGPDGPVATIGGTSILVSPDPTAILTTAFSAAPWGRRWARRPAGFRWGLTDLRRTACPSGLRRR